MTRDEKLLQELEDCKNLLRKIFALVSDGGEVLSDDLRKERLKEYYAEIVRCENKSETEGEYRFKFVILSSADTKKLRELEDAEKMRLVAKILEKYPEFERARERLSHPIAETIEGFLEEEISLLRNSTNDETTIHHFTESEKESDHLYKEEFHLQKYFASTHEE